MGRVAFRTRARTYCDRIIVELRRSFHETYTPHQIASSFGIGVFITMLPTLGTGLLVMTILVYLFDWINKVALFGSVIVLNPVVKWGVYAASITLGFLLLGPVNGLGTGDLASWDGPGVMIRLWVGNMILAIVATAIAYPLVYHLAATYQVDAADVVDAVIDELEAHEP